MVASMEAAMPPAKEASSAEGLVGVSEGNSPPAKLPQAPNAESLVAVNERNAQPAELLQALGFQRLPEVRTVRPRLPEAAASDEVPTVPTLALTASPKAVVEPGLSAAIGDLFEQLAQQHLLELAAARSGIIWHHQEVAREARERNKMSPRSTRLSPRAGGIASPGNNSAGDWLDEREARLDDVAEPPPATKKTSSHEWLENSTPGHVTKRRVSALMCKQKEGLREVHAESVTEALVDNKETKKIMRARTTKETLQEMLPEAVISETVEMDPEKPRMSVFDRTQIFLQSNRYEIIVAFLLAANVLWMAVETQLSGTIIGFDLGLYPDIGGLNDTWRSRQDLFPLGDLLFTLIFAFDVIIRIAVLRRAFWTVKMNYLDVAVCIMSLVEVVVVYQTPGLLEDFNVDPLLFRLLRLSKLARAVRMVTMNSVLNSLQILTRCLASSATMLFWSFCLLTFFQCVFGMVASTLCRDFVTDDTQDQTLREEVFLYFGTFTRTFLTMFEILFANWAVPCRLLMENISEWFSTFFLVYRCLLGFAVLNVVNAVFVQQTMKIASSDEELAFKQKERELASYTRKVKKLFQTMDASGDGVINFDEFSKLVQSPMLQFLLSQLDLEYHDLLSLFEFLDNGDGQITLTEFIDGAAKLRGTAKALDIWRMETKIEVLFGEVLAAVRGAAHTDVRHVFEKLGFKQLTFTTSPSGMLGGSTANSPGVR